MDVLDDGPLNQMTALDRRLGGLLQNRKGKGRYRQLREYDVSSGSSLHDFVRLSE